MRKDKVGTKFIIFSWFWRWRWWSANAWPLITFYNWYCRTTKQIVSYGLLCHYVVLVLCSLRFLSKRQQVLCHIQVAHFLKYICLLLSPSASASPSSSPMVNFTFIVTAFCLLWLSRLLTWSLDFFHRPFLRFKHSKLMNLSDVHHGLAHRNKNRWQNSKHHDSKAKKMNELYLSTQLTVVGWDTQRPRGI